ncbi:hypothetical protein BGW36DRAFT_395810 [Talaromyces proteolyticus]|uniref:SAP domain-containing protein n=1 Tax=Talaromyces proteolyticus TaxID=1131652 RepID=A0AAD4Q2V8_9EURO|nr:uncharacterized protein BGW36DRAFT_395810 [Talaromyces proteolyticus]KAH8700792.1 hypothetical protein BGW36DRAFT_395810 [Talaromyces proteolyticus]
MTSEYEKKTVAQLQELLKARSLPTTGKKADLIARLHEADKSANESAAKEAKADTVEDVIDWDDDAPGGEGAPKETTQPTTEASAAVIAAGGQGAVSNPVAVPNQTLGEDPAKTNDLHVESQAGQTAAAEEKKEEKPAVDYSIGLQATDLESELEKRKARAAKFGIVNESGDAETGADKALERAKRFGTGESAPAINGLDQALPERSQKRGRGDDQGGRGGKRRNFGGHNRHRNRNGPSNSNKGNNPAGRSNEPKSVFSDKDKAALEARKKRFTTAA